MADKKPTSPPISSVESKLLGLAENDQQSGLENPEVTPVEHAVIEAEARASDETKGVELHLLQLSLQDFAVDGKSPSPPKAPKSKPKPEASLARGLGRLPASVVGALVFALLAIVLTATLRWKPEALPPTVRESVAQTAQAIKQKLPSSKAAPLPAPRSPAAAALPATTATSSGATNPATPEPDDDSLSEEDRLAKTDPAWRKRWETYKRLFILANQMKQQPPARPMMPGARRVEEPPAAPPPDLDDEDDNPNPFGFPE